MLEVFRKRFHEHWNFNEGLGVQQDANNEYGSNGKFMKENDLL